jgi:hypothetical protein
LWFTKIIALRVQPGLPWAAQAEPGKSPGGAEFSIKTGFKLGGFGKRFFEDRRP